MLTVSGGKVAPGLVAQHAVPALQVAVHVDHAPEAPVVVGRLGDDGDVTESIPKLTVMSVMSSVTMLRRPLCRLPSASDHVLKEDKNLVMKRIQETLQQGKRWGQCLTHSVVCMGETMALPVKTAE